MLFTPILIFLGIANLTYVLLNLQLLKGLRRLADDKAQPPSPLPKITVLVAARNEEARIRKCLDGLIAQDYAADKLQIIVVDDRSTDGTAAILQEYALRLPVNFNPLSISETEAGISPKKYALSQGLRNATGEIIITTDADCTMPPSWVSSLVSEFSEDTGLVLGMTSYYPLGKPALAWGVQALEFLSYGVVASALVGLRFPVHGNANNIAYRRKVYDQIAGFTSHGGIVSGDDDFLIQGINKLGNWRIRYTVKPNSQVETEPPLNWLQFWEQRKRWASKCSLYAPKQTAFLAGIFSYYAHIPVFILGGVFHRGFLAMGLASWVIKTSADYLVMRRGTLLFAKIDLMRWFLPTSIIHIPVIIAAVLSGSFGEFTWKGQTHRRKVQA